MRTASLAAFAILVVAGLAGCLSSGPDDTAHPDPDPVPGDGDLRSTPTGQGARDTIESFIMEHPFRVRQAGFEEYMQAAEDGIAGLLESFGLEVMRHDYGSGVNVLGIQRGTDAVGPDGMEQWVVLSAHYDTVGQSGTQIGPTVYGAWDDGAGVSVLLELAEHLVHREYPFTLVYAFFDEEEKGLVGSRNFVETFFEDGVHDLVANLNTDPPGLNWPCGDVQGYFPVKVIHEQEKVEAGELPRYAWLHDAVEHGLAMAEVPDAVRDYSPGIPVATVAGEGVSGTSDHANFGRVDVANVFLGGTPTTSIEVVDGVAVSVLTYSFHTPLDTLEQMEARCTEGSLAEGLDTIVQVFVHSLDWMALTGVPPTG